MEYIEKESDVIMLNVFFDQYNPQIDECLNWGIAGNSDLPIMLSGGFTGDNVSIITRFFSDYDPYDPNFNIMPRHIFIDHELKVHYKKVGYESFGDIKQSKITDF